MVQESRNGWGAYLFSFLLTFSLVFLSFSLSRAAEKYPARSINMIVPYAPASGTDLGSKIMADRIAEFLGQPLISVYKPGGGGSSVQPSREGENRMDIRFWLGALLLML
jgi:hypothetical protein